MTRRNLRALLLVLITMAVASACNKSEENHHHHDEHSKSHSASAGHDHDHHSHTDSEDMSEGVSGEADEEGSASLGAHVHGQAHFALAVDENIVALELTAPAQSVVGFEKNPTSDEHKATWSSFESKWKEQNSKFIALESSLNCNLSSAKAVLEVEGEHAEVRAEATYNCAKAPKQNKFELGLVKELPGITKLEIEVLPNDSASYVKTLELGQAERTIPKYDF